MELIKIKRILTGIVFIMIISSLWISENTNDAFAFDKEYSGRVIDADTKEPIEGAIIVFAWYKEKATIAGPSQSLHDVKEALTDKDGRWRIEGPKGNCRDLLPGLLQLMGIACIEEQPEIIIFKPGYCAWKNGFVLKACQKMKYSESDNGEGTFELPKLTNKEDRLRNVGIGTINDGKEVEKKQKEFIRLLSEEMVNLGLKPLSILKELENEK
ncbi:MAG: hypothetical protein AB1480_04635 [Nitrospirota bacterium]